MRIKKIISIILAVILAVTAASCSKSDDNNKSGNGSSTGTNGYAKPDATKAATNETPATKSATNETSALTNAPVIGINWTLDGDGTLIISGNGKMDNYMYIDKIYAPWYSERDRIKKVIIENGVTSIGDEAFRKCTSLTSITIPNSVTSIGEQSFNDCESLANITIPDSVTSIGVSAFFGCKSLTNINLADGVESIGANAFYDAGYYNDASNWKSGVLYIGKHLISAKNDISGEYTIKTGTLTVAQRAFENCGSLSKITIPDGVTAIGGGAFLQCKSLKSITIPNSVTWIGFNAFDHCDDLTIYCPSGSFAEEYAKENRIKVNS